MIFVPFVKTPLLLMPSARRGVSDASSGLLKIDGERRAAILAAETAQAEQNKASKEVAAKGRGDEAEFERFRALVAEKKAEVADMNARAKELDEALTDALASPLNLPHDDIPDGADEADNVKSTAGAPARNRGRQGTL